MRLPQQWERVAELSFGPRPNDPPARQLFCEVMARYSNVVLTRQPDDEVLLCAYQVRRSGVASGIAGGSRTPWHDMSVAEESPIWKLSEAFI